MTELTGPTRDWLESTALPGQQILRATPLSGGYRNDNLLLECADGSRYVLRRHLCDNRAGIEAALAGLVGGSVPVARVIAMDLDGAALLLEFVAGTTVDVLLPALTGEQERTVGSAAGRALAAIGAIRFDRDGFFTDAELRPQPMNGEAELDGFVDDCLRRLDPGWALPRSEQDGLRRLAHAWAPLVADAAGSARLVHSDFNPKNLLATQTVGGWRITVLDWEFAYSGSPLADLGNLLRFGDTAFTEGVLAGLGPLPAGWRDTARALDLFAVAEFLTRGPQQPIAGYIRALIRAMAVPD